MDLYCWPGIKKKKKKKKKKKRGKKKEKKRRTICMEMCTRLPLYAGTIMLKNTLPYHLLQHMYTYVHTSMHAPTHARTYARKDTHTHTMGKQIPDTWGRAAGVCSGGGGDRVGNDAQNTLWRQVSVMVVVVVVVAEERLLVVVVSDLRRRTK